MERRFIQATEVRASGTGSNPKISGYAAVFNSTTTIQAKNGSFRKCIKPGAFSHALNQDTVCLFNHNDLYVLGRPHAC
jgi:phage head maturation protease